MKKSLSVLLCLAILFGFVSCNKSIPQKEETTTADASETTVFEITTQRQPQGVQSKNIALLVSSESEYAVEMQVGSKAVEYVSQELISEWTDETKFKINVIKIEVSSPSLAQTAAEEFTTFGVDCAILCCSAEETLSAAGVFEKAEIPFVSVSACPVKYPSSYKHGFSFPAADDEIGNMLAQTANEQKLKNVYVISLSGDESGQSQAYFFAQGMKALGLNAQNVTVEKDNENIGACVGKAIASGCDAIAAMLPSCYAETLIYEAYRQGITSVLASPSWQNSDVLSLLSRRHMSFYTVGSYVVPSNDSACTELKKWLEKNSDSVQLGVSSLYAMNACFALSSALSSEGDLIANIKATNLPFSYGNVKFEKNGTLSGKPFVVTQKSDNWVKYEK